MSLGLGIGVGAFLFVAAWQIDKHGKWRTFGRGTLWSIGALAIIGFGLWFLIEGLDKIKIALNDREMAKNGAHEYMGVKLGATLEEVNYILGAPKTKYEIPSAPEQKKELGSGYYQWREDINPIWRKDPLLKANQKYPNKMGLVYTEDLHQLLGIVIEYNKVIQITCVALDGYIRGCANLGGISVYYSSEMDLKQHLGAPITESLRAETKTISYGKNGRWIGFDLKKMRVSKIEIRSEISSYEFNPFDVFDNSELEEFAKGYGGTTDSVR